MKTVVDKTVHMHIEITGTELVEAITEYVKHRTPRLTGRRKGGLLHMENIRIKVHANNGDELDIEAELGSDIDHVDFRCEVK